MNDRVPLMSLRPDEIAAAREAGVVGDDRTVPAAWIETLRHFRVTPGHERDALIAHRIGVVEQGLVALANAVREIHEQIVPAPIRLQVAE